MDNTDINIRRNKHYQCTICNPQNNKSPPMKKYFYNAESICARKNYSDDKRSQQTR